MKRRQIRRRLGTCILLSWLLSALVLPSTALAYDKIIAAYDGAVSNPGYTWPRKSFWTGTFGMNRVMNSPTITGDHVNSVYINSYDWNIYEVGWAWSKAVGKPQYFVVIKDNGVLRTPALGQILYDATKGDDTWYNLDMQSNESPPAVDFRIKGVLRAKYTPASTPDGLSVWGSERKYGDESNFAHFWSMAKRRHDMVLVGWSDFSWYRSGDHPAYHLWKLNGTEREGWSNPVAIANTTNLCP